MPNFLQADLTGNSFTHTSEYIGNIIEDNRKQIAPVNPNECECCGSELKELEAEIYNRHCSECFNA